MPLQQKNLEQDTNLKAKDGFLNLNSLKDVEEIKGAVIMLGLKLWNKTVRAQNIFEVNHCKEIIKSLRGGFMIIDNSGLNL